jgi:hypothetical protein
MINAKDILDNKSLFSFRDKNLIIDIYQYYFYNGYHSILTEKIIRLSLSFLMIFLFNFIINCIDYTALLNPPDTTQLSQSKHQLIYKYINMANWFPNNPYLIICFSIYCIYLLSLIGNIISSIRKFSKIRIIYNQILSINDYRLKFITWDDIISVICRRLNTDELLDTSGINIYTINNRICYQANLVISMFRAGLITIPNYSKFLEWNYIFCIIEPMTNAYPMIHSYNFIQSSRPNQNTPNQNKPNQNIQLTDTLEDINQLTNKEIYNRFNDTTQEPLLPPTPTIEQEIAYYERAHNQSTSTDYLDNISSNSQSPETSTTNNPNYRTTFVSNSIIHIHRFDSILYNTLTIDTRTPANSVMEYLQKVHYRINLVIAINLFAMPFMIIILGLYLFIKYGEKLYANPSILFQRKINVSTLWKLRYYNELPNLFRERIIKIEVNMDKIINVYQSPIRQIITRFLVFLIGCVFLLLLALSFVATENFAKLEIIPNHNVIWFLGVCGTLLLILNKIVSPSYSPSLTKKEQLNAFESLREDLITIYPQLNKIEDREYIVSLIHDIYKPRIVNMFYELVNLIIAPYILYKWKKQVANNAVDILELLVNHYQLGNVCRHSIFTNREEIIKKPHMMLSLKEFRVNHEWDLPEVIRIDCTLNNSVLLQNTILE